MTKVKSNDIQVENTGQTTMLIFSIIKILLSFPTNDKHKKKST